MAIDIGVPSLALQGYLRAKQQEQEKERQEQLHEEAQAQLQEIAKFHAGNLDIQKKHLALTQSALKAHLLQQYYENVAGGKQQPASFQDISGIGADTSTQAPIPGGTTPTGATVSTQGQPVQALPGEVTPEQAAQRTANIQTNVLGPAEIKQAVAKATALGPVEAQAAGQKTQAEKEAEIAASMSPEGRRLAQANQAFEMSKVVAMGKPHIEAARIMAAAHIGGIQLENAILMSPETVKSGVNYLMHGGDLSGIPNPKTKQAAENAISSIKDPDTGQNWITPFPDMGKNLQKMQAVDGLLRQWRAFNEKYSRDGTLNPTGSIATLPSVMHPLDYNTELKALESQAGDVAKMFEGNARVTNTIIGAQKAGLHNPFQDKAMNNVAVNSHATTLNTETKSQFRGMPPSEINYYMMENGIREFGGLSGAAPKIPKGAKAPAGRTFVVNPKNELVHIPVEQVPQALGSGYKPATSE